MSELKFGRLAARHPVGLRDFVAYLKDPLPKAPEVLKAPDLADWGMLGNDQYGDCTIAGAAHLDMANALENSETVPTISTQQAVSTYLALTGGADTGLVEADVLQTWREKGLFSEKNAGYAPVDHRSFAELRSVTAAFGGTYLGIAVPAPAQQQFAEGKPWALTGTAADRDIIGGHCVPAVGYDRKYLYVVTWAKLQAATWEWVKMYLEEAWAVATEEDERVDAAALAQDLARL